MSSAVEQQVSLPSDQNATGRTLGDEEILFLSQAIESGVLTSTKGQFVKRLESRFAETVGASHAYACSSGSSAIHAAIAAVDPEPGDEIITSPITDMGALTPILYQSGIPVFADVDAKTGNVTAETIRARLSERTKAIVVTHLFGNPCEMGEIMKLARERNIPVIEDCAQAFLAEHQDQQVGTIGDIGCFSLQQGKHITTGEGGIVVTNHKAYARRMFLFINKAWGYGDSKPDHYFLALNARMCELQGAVALAQLEKLTFSVEQRCSMASILTDALKGIPGVTTPAISSRSKATWWKYWVLIDETVIPGGAPAVANGLRELGIASAPRYIQKPAFRCEIFAEQRTFGNSRFPFTLARPEAVDYDSSRFPGSFALLDQILVLPWNERYTEDHVHAIADGLRQVIGQIGSGGAS